MKVGSRIVKRWRRDRGTTEPEGGVEVAEEGGRRPCESCHGVVGAAGRAEKTTQTQTSIAAAEGLWFPTRA